MALAVTTEAQLRVPMALLRQATAAGLLMADAAAISPRLFAPVKPDACWNSAAVGWVGKVGRLQRESRLQRDRGEASGRRLARWLANRSQAPSHLRWPP